MRRWILLLELGLRSILPPFSSFESLNKVFKRKLENRPNDYDVMWFLGNFYMWHKKYSEARLIFEALMKTEKGGRNVRLLLAEVYFKLGQYNRVEAILSPVNLAENDKENYYLGDSLIELGRFGDAIKYLSNYVRHYPRDYVPFVRIGYAYYMEGLYEHALRAYREAERLNPSRVEIKGSIDLCLEKMKQEPKKGDMPL